ncbi:MAG TPA: putative zinc-binding protein [Nitrospira sp.]
MKDEKQHVVIVPCSGIGKSLGTVTREAAYELCDNLRPGDTRLVALSKLVLGDEKARERVRTNPAVTIDGCKQMCASKLVKHNGGTVAQEIAVFDAFRNHKGLKPEGIAELNPEGMQLVRIIAEEIAAQIDAIIETRSKEGGQHA